MAKRAGGIRAGEAFVEMYARDEKVTRSLNNLKNKFSHFNRQINVLSGRQLGFPIFNRLDAGFLRLRGLFQGLQKDLTGLRFYHLARDLNRVGAAIAQFGFRLKLAGVAFTAGLLATIKPAARVESSFTRQRLLLGESAMAAEQYVQMLANATNRTGLFVRESLNSFQAFFQGLDFGTEKATDFAQALTKLQLDFAAAAGQTSEESMRRFIAALAGSPEVLDQFGIDLKELSLNAVLAAHGIDGVRKATEKQKTLARMLLIFDRLGKQGAIDAAAKTMTNFATILDQMRGYAIELGAAIGDAMKPAFIELSKFIKGAGDAMKVFLKDNKKLVMQVLAGGVAITVLGGAILSFGIALRVVSAAMAGISALFGLPGVLLGVVGHLAKFALFLPTVLGPTLSLIAGIGVMAAVFKNWEVIVSAVTDSAANAMKQMRDVFTSSAEKVTTAWKRGSMFFNETFSGMAQAARSGNARLALEILQLSIETTFDDVREYITGVWDSAYEEIIRQTEKFKNSIQRLLNDIDAPGWIETASKLAGYVASGFRGIGKFGEFLGFGAPGNRRVREAGESFVGPAERTRQLMAEQVRSNQELQEYLARGQQEKDQYAARVAAEEAAEAAKASAEMMDFLEGAMDPFITQAALDTAREEGDKKLARELALLLAEQIPGPQLFDAAQFMKGASEELRRTGNAIGEAFGVQGGFADRISMALTGNKVQKDIAQNTAETARATQDMSRKMSGLAGTFGA